MFISFQFLSFISFHFFSSQFFFISFQFLSFHCRSFSFFIISLQVVSFSFHILFFPLLSGLLCPGLGGPKRHLARAGASCPEVVYTSVRSSCFLSSHVLSSATRRLGGGRARPRTRGGQRAQAAALHQDVLLINMRIHTNLRQNGYIVFAFNSTA